VLTKLFKFRNNSFLYYNLSQELLQNNVNEINKLKQKLIFILEKIL
jgi:hypothetical protein